MPYHKIVTNLPEARLCVVECQLEHTGISKSYRIRSAGSEQRFHLKWFDKRSRNLDPRLYDRLAAMIEAGAPSQHFLWPIGFAWDPRSETEGLGCVLPLPGPRFRRLLDFPPARTIPRLKIAAQVMEARSRLLEKGYRFSRFSLDDLLVNPEGDVLFAACDQLAVRREDALATEQSRPLA